MNSRELLEVGIIVLAVMSLVGVLPIVKLAEAHHDHGNPSSHFKITSLKEIGDNIESLVTSSGIRVGNVLICADFSTCIGTNSDDVIYAEI